MSLYDDLIPLLISRKRIDQLNKDDNDEKPTIENASPLYGHNNITDLKDLSFPPIKLDNNGEVMNEPLDINEFLREYQNLNHLSDEMLVKEVQKWLIKNSHI